MVTSAPPSPAALPEGDRPAEVGRTRRLGKVLTVVAVLALVAFWAWILSGAPKRTNPDRLSDRSRVASIARRCQAAVREVDALPSATTAKSATDRADVVDQATGALDRLVDDIEAAAPPSGDDAVRLRGWVRDWRTYLHDRRDYARRLRRTPRAQFLLDENRAGDPIDRPIKNFADINEMPVCAPPGDVG